MQKAHYCKKRAAELASTQKVGTDRSVEMTAAPLSRHKVFKLRRKFSHTVRRTQGMT